MGGVWDAQSEDLEPLNRVVHDFPRLLQPMERRLDPRSQGLRVQRPQARAVAFVGLLSAVSVSVCAALFLRRTAPAPGNSSSARVVLDKIRGKLIRNVQAGRCLDWSDSVLVKTPTCDESIDTQRWDYSIDHFELIKIGDGQKCLDFGGAFVHYWNCWSEKDEFVQNQKWVYDPNLQHIKTRDGKFCLEVNPDGGAVGKEPCEIGHKRQTWTLQDEELTIPPPTETPVALVITKAPTTTSVVTTTAATSTTTAPTTSSSLSATTTKTTVATSTSPAKTTVATSTNQVTQPATTTSTTKTSTTTTSTTTTSTTNLHAVRVPMYIRHQGQDEYCLDGGGHDIHMFNCSAENTAQHWEAVRGGDGKMTGQLRNARHGKCLTRLGDQVKLKDCIPQGDLAKDDLQMWQFRRNSGHLAPYGNKTGCLDAPYGEHIVKVSVKACDASSKNQKWNEEGLMDEAKPLMNATLILLVLTIPLLLILLVCCVVAIFLCSQRKKREIRKVVDDVKKPSPVAVLPCLPDPKLGVLKFADPRPDTYPPRNADIIAFSFPGVEEPWDKLCCASFLANSYDAGPACLQLKAKGETKNFRNAEAAFQALTFWNSANDFANLSGEEALQQKHARRGQEDWDYAGYDDKWQGMMAVLQAKFKSGSRLEKALEKTGDAFLLNHCRQYGEDPVWSDNYDGEGTNWLGLQLMLLRDRRTGWKKWTKFIESSIDVQTGGRIQPEDMNPNAWQDAVRNARAAVVREMQGEEVWFSEQPLLPADFGYSSELSATESRELLRRTCPEPATGHVAAAHHRHTI